MVSGTDIRMHRKSHDIQRMLWLAQEVPIKLRLKKKIDKVAFLRSSLSESQCAFPHISLMVSNAYKGFDASTVVLFCKGRVLTEIESVSKCLDTAVGMAVSGNIGGLWKPYQ